MNKTISETIKRHRPTLWFVVPLLLGFAAFSQVHKIRVAEPAQIIVDMRISEGNNTVAYWNRDREPPSILEVSPGVRKEYVFIGPSRDIIALRLDPFDTQDAVVDIFGARIEHQGRVIASFTPTDLFGFRAHGMVDVAVVDGALHMRTSTGRGTLRGPTDVPLEGRFPGLIVSAFDGLKDPASAHQLVLLCFGSLAALSFTRRRECVHGMVAAGAFVAPLVVMPWILREMNGLPPIDSAVGAFAYEGLSVSERAYSSWAALLAGMGLAVIGYLASRVVVSRRVPGVEVSDALVRGDEKRNWLRIAWNIAAPLSVILFILFYEFPDIPRAMWKTAVAPFPWAWDYSNHLTWSYLASEGYLPHRDFWYPYGNNYLFLREIASGLLWRYLYLGSVHVGFFLSLYLLSGRRVVWPFAIWVLLGLGELSIMGIAGPNLFPSFARSMSGIAPVLAYVAIDQRKPSFQAAHALFGALCCVALFFEPSQLFNAAPGVFILLCLDLYQDRPASWRAFVTKLLREFAIPAVFLIVFLAGIALQGRWGGFYDFYAHLGDIVKYTAYPTDAFEPFESLFATDYLVIGMPVLLVGLGLVERLQRVSRVRIAAANVLIGMGMVAFMIYQKHTVRPMAPWCFLPQAVALFVYGALRLQEGRRVVNFVLGLTMAGYVAMVLADPLWEIPVAHLRKSNERIATSLDILLRRGAQEETIETVKASRFDDRHFQRYTDEVALATHLRGINAVGHGVKIYVLGDHSYMYVLMGQKSPYQINNYNASPISEQQKVVEWLRTEPPDFVVWDPADNVFDGVPHHIRVPLIYNEVVSSFVPVEKSGKYTLLRPRRADELPAMDFWRSTLGATVDYRHLARNSSFDRFAPCSDEPGIECSEFMEITCDRLLGYPENLGVGVQAGETSFGLHIATVPGETTYRLLLDRVWFWDAAKRAGLPRHISRESLPPGVKVSVIRRRTDPDILY